jgi:hypothetical protein
MRVDIATRALARLTQRVIILVSLRDGGVEFRLIALPALAADLTLRSSLRT